MALRRTAEGVEDALTDYMHEHRIDDIRPAAERVLVVVDGDEDGGIVLRNAWRLAGALRCDLIAVAVAPPGGLAAMRAEQRSVIEKAFGLAEDLGMRTRVIEGALAADAIADVVRDEHVTLIVMRHVRESGWRRLRGESLVDALLDRLDNVDIHLVEARRGAG